MNRLIKHVATLGLTIVLTACGSSGGTPQPPAPPTKPPVAPAPDKTVQTNCLGESTCNAQFIWGQSDFQDGYTTIITIKKGDTTVLTTPSIPERGITGNSASTAYKLIANTTYTASFVTQNSKGDSPTATITFTTTSYTPPPSGTATNGLWLTLPSEDLQCSNITDCKTASWPGLFPTQRISYVFADWPTVQFVPLTDTTDPSAYQAKYVQQSCPAESDSACSAAKGAAAISYVAGGSPHLTNGGLVTAAYANNSSWPNVKVIPVMEFQIGTKAPNYEVAKYINDTATTAEIKALATAIATTINNDPHAAGIGFDVEPALKGTPAETFYTQLAKTLDPNKSIVMWGVKADFCSVYNGNVCPTVGSSSTATFNLWNILKGHHGIAMIAGYGGGTGWNANQPSDYQSQFEEALSGALVAAENHVPFFVALPSSAQSSEWEHAIVYSTHTFTDPYAGKSTYTSTPYSSGSASGTEYTPNPPVSLLTLNCHAYQTINQFIYSKMIASNSCPKLSSTPKVTPLSTSERGLFLGVTLYQLSPYNHFKGRCDTDPSIHSCATAPLLLPASLLQTASSPLPTWDQFLSWSATAQNP